MYRRWKDSKGKDKEYENIIKYVICHLKHFIENKLLVVMLILNDYFRKQVVSGRLEADRDGVVVPLTLEDYCKVSHVSRSSAAAAAMDSDFYVEDYDLDVESDANSEEEYQDDATDSGNGES